MSETPERRPLPILSTLLVGGGLVVVLTRYGLDWFGHLPGDISAEREGASIYIPFTSVVVAAVALSLVVQVVQRWIFRRH